MTATQRKVGIVAGAGEMPRQIVQACVREGRPYFVAAVDEFAEAFEPTIPHERNPISKIGATFAALQRNGCQDVVFAGKLARPDGGKVKLRPDWGGLVFLVRLFGTLERSDDRLHRTIAAMLAARGMTVVSPLMVAPSLTAAAGCLTRTTPTDAVRASFKTALRLAKEHGATKQGQAVVIEGTTVIAREARAGTDAMLASLDAQPRASAVLVKAMAPTQLMTIDPPAIGEGTVVNAAKAGLVGILIEAGRSVIMDEARVRARADELGLFVCADSVDG